MLVLVPISSGTGTEEVECFIILNCFAYSREITVKNN
jgi:hypothetical protein